MSAVMPKSKFTKLINIWFFIMSDRASNWPSPQPLSILFRLILGFALLFSKGVCRIEVRSRPNSFGYGHVRVKSISYYGNKSIFNYLHIYFGQADF